MSFSANAVEAKTSKINHTEGCGICLKEGAEVWWFSHISRSAHSVCVQSIENIEADLLSAINATFADIVQRRMAHTKAVEEVSKFLGGVSIKTFLETQGAEKLKSLFDSIGQYAAWRYADKPHPFF